MSLDITLKVGSVVTVPVPVSWSTSGSDHPNLCNITIANGLMTITALSPGTAWLTAAIATDLGVNLQVTVVP